MKKILITTLIVVFLAAATPASATVTDNGDETLTDDVTGLMWTKSDQSQEEVKVTACAYCEGLEVADYTDWRAPTIEELQTIIDYRYDSPAIDGSIFDTITTTDSEYWYSSTPQLNTSLAWGINTSSGIIDSTYSFYQKQYIRCVRGDMVKTTFVDNGDQTVTSNDGLVWSKHTSTSTNWDEANDYCSNLVIDDMSDWFLPTIEELRTLVAYDQVNPAVDESLKSLPDFEAPTGEAFYWTATEQSGNSENNAWQINFYNGYTAPAVKTLADRWVRCAHEAPPENFCDCPVCQECEVCPVCEPEIVTVKSPCSCGDCDLTGLTTYNELKAKRSELSKAIKELKKCHSAATRAMYKAHKAEREALMAKKKAEYLAKLKAKKNKNK